jgi:hypothetical protein
MLMICGARPRGYTVVEVMIFLAVTGALLVSAMFLVAGQQSKTEFAQAVREFESQVRDIINDVSVGFYPTNGRVKCEPRMPLGSGVVMSEVPTEQGTNAGCTFVGRVIQFAPQGSQGRVMRVYTIAGQRLSPSPPPNSVLREVTSLEDAEPRPIARGSGGSDTTPDFYEDMYLGPVRIGKVSYTHGALTETMGGIGIFTTFRGYSGNSLGSGSTSADLGPLSNVGGSTSLDQDPQQFVDRVINKLRNPAFKNTMNPSGGVTICILSEGTTQYALLKIGGESRSLTTELTISGGSVCP